MPNNYFFLPTPVKKAQKHTKQEAKYLEFVFKMPT